MIEAELRNTVGNTLEQERRAIEGGGSRCTYRPHAHHLHEAEVRVHFFEVDLVGLQYR